MCLQECPVTRRYWNAFIALFLILMISACGGLRYSQVDTEAGNFHPRRLGVLPVDVGTYEEARGTVDQMIAGVLTEKKWFNDVVAGDDINRQFHANEEFRAVMTDYMAKLKTVNFSDSQLSARIGELCQVDSFLVVSVDYWNYTTENGDKVGKVSLGIKMIQAETGKVLWKAGHFRAEKYRFIKPELLSVARTLFREMIGYMPR